MGEVSTIGLDIAKAVFQVHGVDGSGTVVIRKRVSRVKMLEFFSDLPPCLVGIEACPSAHHWGRQLQLLGHTVKLMPPSYVKAYLKRSKNDANDAAAICEAVTRPSMRFVPIKTKQQQTALMLHRTRQLLVRQRTMLSNALRGHLAELGVVSAKGRNGTGELLRIIADADDHRIPRPPAAFSISWRGSTSRSEPRSDPSTRAFWPGIARARRAGGWRRSRASARLSPRLWLPRLATGRHLHRGATSPPGSGWCRSNIRPVARTGSAVSPSRAIDTCDGCWLSARWPSSAMHRSMGPRTGRGSHD